MHINRALNIAQINHLVIQDEQLFNGTLRNAVNSLPDLMTLYISSLSFEESRELCEEEVDVLLSGESTSQITKVCLEMMMEITDIYFLMDVCPKMEYLRVGSLNDMDVGLFVREILHKINSENNQHLRLLSFIVEEANDELIQKLAKMIDTEKLVTNYSIQYVYHKNIFLQWK
jgi:DNA integrity scanning protein DisA with diadenylate cyclase activity